MCIYVSIHVHTICENEFGCVCACVCVLLHVCVCVRVYTCKNTKWLTLWMLGRARNENRVCTSLYGTRLATFLFCTMTSRSSFQWCVLYIRQLCFVIYSSIMFCYLFVNVYFFLSYVFICNLIRWLQDRASRGVCHIFVNYVLLYMFVDICKIV